MLQCCFCHHPHTRVIDTRETANGTAIKRRRECAKCRRRFNTYETAPDPEGSLAGEVRLRDGSRTGERGEPGV